MSENDTEIAEAVEVEPLNEWRIFKSEGTTIEGEPRWIEKGALTTRWTYSGPTAREVGEAYGEGTYLLLGEHSRSDLTVVSEKIYRGADVEEAS